MLNIKFKSKLVLSFAMGLFLSASLPAAAAIDNQNGIEESRAELSANDQNLFYQCDNLVFSQLDEMIEFQNLATTKAPTTITECTCRCRAGYDLQLDGNIPLPEGGCAALEGESCQRYADGQEGFYEACWEVTRKLNFFERCWRWLFG